MPCHQRNELDKTFLQLCDLTTREPPLESHASISTAHEAKPKVVEAQTGIKIGCCCTMYEEQRDDLDELFDMASAIDKQMEQFNHKLQTFKTRDNIELFCPGIDDYKQPTLCQPLSYDMGKYPQWNEYEKLRTSLIIS